MAPNLFRHSPLHTAYVSNIQNFKFALFWFKEPFRSVVKLFDYLVNCSWIYLAELRGYMRNGTQKEVRRDDFFKRDGITIRDGMVSIQYFWVRNCISESIFFSCWWKFSIKLLFQIPHSSLSYTYSFSHKWAALWN